MLSATGSLRIGKRFTILLDLTDFLETNKHRKSIVLRFCCMICLAALIEIKSRTVQLSLNSEYLSAREQIAKSDNVN